MDRSNEKSGLGTGEGIAHARHLGGHATRIRMRPPAIAVFSSCAVFDTLNFFIIFARWASTVLTLIFSRCPISLFLKPAQISSRISCSLDVNDSGLLARGGGSMSIGDVRRISFRFVRTILYSLLLVSRAYELE